MYIKKIRICNFKSFDDVTLEFDRNLNVFTGANNSGKTSVLEAVSLWVECFKLAVGTTSNSRNKLDLDPGDSYFPSSRLYVSSNSFRSIRNAQANDIFRNQETRNSSQSVVILLEVTLSSDDSDESKKKDLELPFGIKKSAADSYEILNPFRIKQDVYNEGKIKEADQRDFYKQLHQHLGRTNIDKALNFILSEPVSFCDPEEKFETQLNVTYASQIHGYFPVLLNRLYYFQLSNPVGYESFKNAITEILGRKLKFDLKFEGDHSQDSNIKVKAKTAQGTYLNLSLFGSGTLQIIETILGFYENDTDQTRLTFFLMDEPDSHIHREVQKRLFDFFLRGSADTKFQLFATTHNEGLIRATRPDYLFRFEGTPKATYKPLSRQLHGKGKSQVGFLQSPKQEVLAQLGHESALDYLNALDADLILMVEGSSDVVYIDRMVSNYYTGFKKPYIMYWVFEGVSQALQTLKTTSTIFKAIKNSHSLWDKCILVLDRDDLTDKKRQRLKSLIGNHVGKELVVHIWESRMVEATFLRNSGRLLINLIQRYLYTHDEGKHTEPTVEDAFNTSYLRLKDELIETTKKALEDSGNVVKSFNDINKAMELGGFKEVLFSKSNNAKDWEDYRKATEAIMAGEQIERLAGKNDVLTLINDTFEALGAESLIADTSGSALDELLKYWRLLDDKHDEWDHLINQVIPSKLTKQV